MSNLWEILELEKDLEIWSGLPEHVQEDAEAPFVLDIHVKTKDDLLKLANLVQQDKLKREMKTAVYSIWYPELKLGERGSNSQYIWVEIENECV